MNFEWAPLAGGIRHGIRQFLARSGHEYREKDRNSEFTWGQPRHGPPQVVLK